MASILSQMVLFMAILMNLSSYSLPLNLPTSTISAAPAFLPNPPPFSPQSSPPTLSPDITPLFPSPGGTISPSPTESSSLPTIPSSPSPQSSPPTLSPDITPLFPSPGGTISPSPTESSSLPTIPSNPSPPNPDQVAIAPGTSTVISPSGSLPLPFSDALRSHGSLNPLLLQGLVVFRLLIQLSGV